MDLSAWLYLPCSLQAFHSFSCAYPYFKAIDINANKDSVLNQIKNAAHWKIGIPAQILWHYW
ncbi:MAG: hypothetical protein IPI68_14905 [Chitinophagaceae bacterium]|nr:hypothetical protein [Chitinophagaceae bacterium]